MLLYDPSVYSGRLRCENMNSACLKRFILRIWAASGRVYALESFTAPVLFVFGDFYKCEWKPPDVSVL